MWEVISKAFFKGGEIKNYFFMATFLIVLGDVIKFTSLALCLYLIFKAGNSFRLLSA